MGEHRNETVELKATADSLDEILELSRSSKIPVESKSINGKREYRCGNVKVSFDEFNPYDADECEEREDRGNCQEFIRLNPPTVEEIEKAFSEAPTMIVDHPPQVRDLTRDQFKNAIECHDDLVSVMVYPELELVLKGIQNRMQKLVKPIPQLSWDGGRLAINGARTKLRACEAFEGVRALSKLGTHEFASEAVAQLMVERLKELF